MEHFPRVNLVWSVLLAANPSLLLVTMLVPIGLAQLQQTPGLPQIPGLSQIPGFTEISGLLPQITRFFASLGVGGLSRANGKCLSSLVDIPRCLTLVFGSLVNGQFSIIGNKQVSKITANKAALPVILSGNQDIQEYWSSLLGVPGCLTDVMNSLFNGKVNFFDPTFCKAITLVSDHYLPKLFLFNPAFHSTLKNDYQTGIGKKTLQNPGNHFQALIGVLMRFMDHSPGVYLVWLVLLAANPSLLLVTSVGPRCSHSTHCSFCSSGVN
ncbi:hypothetical protein CFP56_034299, partial [Quercus suber]